METPEINENTLPHQAGVVVGYAAAATLLAVAAVKTTRFVKSKLAARKAHKPPTEEQ